MSNTKITNVIGVPIPQWLVGQFNTRANENSRISRSTQNLQYLANKTGWVRAVSSVQLFGDDNKYFSKYTNSNNLNLTESPNSLAKNYVLFGGTSKYKKEANSFEYELRSGLGGSYGMLGEEEVNRYGYQPMPGITSVTIETMGRMGSVRSATINFKVFNKLQLDIIDALYFKLGYTLFLEWGNTCYYDSDEKTELSDFHNFNLPETDLKFSEDFSIDPFEKNLTKEKIHLKIAENVLKSKGNYDGMLGVIVNFNFSRKEDASYDCTVKIMALGALAESIKINRSDVFTDGLKDELRKIVDKANIKIEKVQKEKTNEIDEKIKKLKEELENLEKENDKVKTINEVFIDKVKKDFPDIILEDGETKTRIDEYEPKVYLANNYLYYPSSFETIADTQNINQIDSADILYTPKTSWGIRKLGNIVSSETKIKSVTFSKLDMSRVLSNQSGNIFKNSEKLPQDLGRYIIYTNKDGSRNYVLKIVIDKEHVTEDIGKLIYKQLTETDIKIEEDRIFQNIFFRIKDRNKKINEYSVYNEEYGTNLRYNVPEISVSGIRLKNNIVYGIAITDSSLLKEMTALSDSHIRTKELIDQRNKKIQKEIKDSIEESEKNKSEAISDNPLIDVELFQKEEIGKHNSALEKLLRLIQVYSLNRTTDTTTKVEIVSLIGDVSNAVLKSTGLYSTIYDQVFGTEAITDITSLAFFAKYGFNHNLMSGNTQNIGNMEFDHTSLLNSYVIPYQITQEFSEGVTLNRPVYIPFGTLLMFLNHVSLIYDVKTENGSSETSPILYIDYNPNTNYCLTSPQQFSTNPIDFLIPFSGTKEDFEKLLDKPAIDAIGKENIFDPQSEKDNGISGYLPVFRDRTKSGKEAYQGKIMNVLVDIQYLLNTIKRFSTSDSTNSTYLKSFIESILSDMTKALGNFNVLRLAYDDTSNCLYIVDDQLTPGNKDEDTMYRSQETNRTELPLHGVKSIAKNLEIRTDISSKLASMIAISSNPQNSQGTLSTDASSFGFVNSNFTDRYIPVKGEASGQTTKSEEKKNTEGDIEVAKNFNEYIKQFYGESPNIVEAAIATVTNYYMSRMAVVKNETPATRASVMIPVSVNFTTDGISGLSMYQAFSINEELLPYTYSTAHKNLESKQSQKKIGFCIVGLSHTIESNQWSTAVKAQMVYLKDSVDYIATAVTTPLPKGQGSVSNQNIQANINTKDAKIKNNKGFTKFISQPGVREKVIEIANYLGVSENDLYVVFGAETGGTFDPSIQNPISKATGLIQFLKSTAVGLGTTVDTLKNMTALEQLDYVKKYYSPYKNKTKNVYDLYTATFFPLALSKPSDFVLQTPKQSASLISKDNPAIAKAAGKKPGDPLTKYDFYTYVTKRISQFIV